MTKMTKNIKISLELDPELNKRLKQYCLDNYPIAHGKQQEVIREALLYFLIEAEDEREFERQKKIEKETKGAMQQEAGANEPIEALSRSKPKTKRKRPIEAEDQAKIRAVWDTGERNISAISRQFPQYTDRQVRHWIGNNLRS